MDTETMQLLSALLALFAAGGSLVLLAARLAANRLPAAANFVLAFRPVALPLAFMVAGFAMFGSLWFSEAANYNPCKLCWYQRIAMYSLAIILVVALVRRAVTKDDAFASQREITPYAIVLAVLGSVVSTYHYLLEWNPTWESNVCSLDVPCTTIWFREFGFVTLPFMALCGYVSIIILLATTHRPKAVSFES
ncbi:MAG: disulfide bond formation protein B [Actinobacteria bacterium]|nr:disulfide bond formation protein B [Actinomycetota bacterium]